MEVCDFVLIVLRNVGVEKADCTIDLGLGFFWSGCIGNLRGKRKWRM